MTRFEREISGGLGAFWKKNAEEEVRKAVAQAETQATVDEDGAIRWNSNGRYLMDDFCEKLEYAGYAFSREATAKKREAQDEKYKGDALLQKSYTVDFLTKKTKINEGEVPQYYVENSHEAIISPAVFDEVQHQMAVRHPGKNRLSCTGTFSSRIKCGDCGSWYGSKVWHSNDKYRKVVWQCNHKFDGGEKCTTPHLDEETVKALFLKAANAIFGERDSIREDYEAVKERLYETSKLEAERIRLQEEMNIVAEMIQQCVNENARIALDQTEYQKKYDGLADRFDRIKERLEAVGSDITERMAKREKTERFLAELEKRDGPLTEFNEEDWYSLVEYATVYSREDIRFTFKNGNKSIEKLRYCLPQFFTAFSNLNPPPQGKIKKYGKIKRFGIKSNCIKDGGKIDIILTKSISRFARNTVDLLETVRHLKSHGIEVRFEKEHINSLSEDGELMLTLLASFAQEESRSISDNVKWGVRKRFQSGEIGAANKHILGYRYDDGLRKYVIIPEEAESVRWMFQMYIDGVSLREIAESMNRAGIRTTLGNNFQEASVRQLIFNEVYAGDIRRQKCYMADPITKMKVKNCGELPQYYMADCHEAIIDRETYAKVQAEMERRSGLVNPVYPFTGKIKCGICGQNFTRRKGTAKGREYASWFCRAKKESGMTCRSHNYSEQKLMEICAGLMGAGSFDGAAFEKSVRLIKALPDGSLEMQFFDGQTKRWEMPPKPAKLPDKPVKKRPVHLFDGMIFCGQCGRRYGRAVSESKDRHLYWYCRAKSHHGVTCDSVNYPDSEIKEIFCMVMGLETFDENFFTETVERIVVQKTGSIDFHLKDGTVRTYETLKLRSNRHKNTSTDEFTGKIRCASCGNIYHRYCCYGKYTYWRCSGKSKVRTECSGRDFQDSDIRRVSAYMMGMEDFDGAAFGEAVEYITALPDGSLEFHFYDGRAERWQR